MALYPYTLQPVALNLTEEEFRAAQMALFEKSKQSFGLASIKFKEWAILGVISLLAVAGLLWVSGYSTVLFWLMIIGVILYLLTRTVGFRWYVEKEFEKQLDGQKLPDEMKHLKIGIQAHGIILNLPVANPNPAPALRGMQMRAPQSQQGIIPWSAVTSWDETADYVFIMFELNGQKGSQILPKRLEKQKFPIDTLKDHLQKIKPAGLDIPGLADQGGIKK